MSIDKSILLDAHNIVYKDADGHDYGSFDQNMQDACNFAMVMTGSMVTIDMAYAILIGLKLAREKQNHKRDNMVDVCGYMEGWSEYKENKHGQRQRTKQRDGMIQNCMQQNNRNGR